MENIENQLFVVDAYAKFDSIMDQHKGQNIWVSYSGGSDSDTIMWMARRLGYNLPAVIFDTGLEYSATWRHVEYMKSEGFDITTIKPTKPIPTAVKEYGYPFISKFVSEMLYRLQRHKFDFEKDGVLDADVLLEKFPKAQIAVKWWSNINLTSGTRFNIENNKLLKEFLIENGLPMRVSPKCCDWSKKKPVKKFAKERNIDLMFLGTRKAEGGIRSSRYKNCFVPKKSYSYDMFFPIFWWNNDEKRRYDESVGVAHSDCYSVYGLKRTGCAGCPFGRGYRHELNILEEHEPKLSKGIKNIFDNSYKWTEKYREFRESN